MGVQKAGGREDPRRLNVIAVLAASMTAVLCALFRDRTGPTAGGSVRRHSRRRRRRTRNV